MQKKYWADYVNSELKIAALHDWMKSDKGAVLNDGYKARAASKAL